MRSISSSVNGLRLAGGERALLRPATVTAGMLTSALLLAAIGVATVYSATFEQGSDFLSRQMVWVGLGVLAFLVGLLVDYHYLLRISPQLYALTAAVVLLVTLFGHEAGGARSWIGIGGLGGQPSDLMKVATVLLLARYLASIRRYRLSLRQLAVAGSIVGLPMALIALQPDLGGAMMFVPLFVGTVLVGGVRARTLLVGALLVVVAAAGLWTFGMRDYQRERIVSFVSPESDPLGAGYQLRQSKIAVGSGQALGRGYRQGTQSQLRFLPARHTDFIFAVLAEEWGFLGAAAVLALYVALLGFGVRGALRARDRSGVLVASGLLSLLAAYVLYNTAMMIGLVPITGIPLPFLSYGGSFTLFCFLSAGIIAGIDRRRYVNR